MDGDIPQYIGFVGRITYENRPTVVLNTSHLLYVHSELTSYTKQHEVRHTVETSAAGLREERHRISYIVEVFRHPAAKEPRLTCPISPATHWRKVWSWVPSDPYNYIFHRFFVPYYIMLLIEDFFLARAAARASRGEDNPTGRELMNYTPDGPIGLSPWETPTRRWLHQDLSTQLSSTISDTYE